MKIIKLTTGIALGCLFYLPFTASAEEYEEAVLKATASLDQANAMGYEWRDSRKLLKNADKANKAGDVQQAIKLANSARLQGTIAITQARQQANVEGPY